MTFCGTVHFFDVGMGNGIQSDMTARAFQSPMNRIGKHFFIDVENPFIACFVIPAHLGIAMTKETIFFIRHSGRLCETDPDKEKKANNPINDGMKKNRR
jgi:hypothetical protein